MEVGEGEWKGPGSQFHAITFVSSERRWYAGHEEFTSRHFNLLLVVSSRVVARFWGELIHGFE